MYADLDGDTNEDENTGGMSDLEKLRYIFAVIDAMCEARRVINEARSMTSSEECDINENDINEAKSMTSSEVVVERVKSKSRGGTKRKWASSGLVKSTSTIGAPTSAKELSDISTSTSTIIDNSVYERISISAAATVQDQPSGTSDGYRYSSRTWRHQRCRRSRYN